MKFSIQIRRYGRFVAAIAFLAVLATLSGAYILTNQRVRTPLQNRYTIYADLPSSTGLTPGLGQAVNVAGVRVGQIAGAKLKNGVARIAMEIDPNKLPHVYDNGTAALVENTPLKDMIMELGPGRPPGKPLDSGGTIPISRTEPPIDSDELTNALDADTRDFFDLLVHDSARGFDGRGKDLHQLFKVLRPTAHQLQDITSALAARRHELRRLVGNLAILTKAAGDKDREIGQVVDAANATLGAVASQDTALQGTVERLPHTLSTLRASLDDVAAFGEELAPTLDGLLPAVRKLPAALADTDPLLVEAAPILRTRIRPLVRQLQPLARDLGPATKSLQQVTPSLTSAFQVLNYVVNETNYNPPGSNEGFLYWTAWFAHNATTFLSTEDAQGSAWRGLALFDCSSFTAVPQFAALLDLALGIVQACNSGGGP
ncbi:MAG: phospholipid/cholesterol/gamma-HCH transport system substrate-binding protein [Solirubrobacteraceae bacterium]|nr:phospholipid/cholesterol/gamma-HCH transport system substrate-binding protein [Solirubrobacteraceae bacterium]